MFCLNNSFTLVWHHHSVFFLYLRIDFVRSFCLGVESAYKDNTRRQNESCKRNGKIKSFLTGDICCIRFQKNWLVVFFYLTFSSYLWIFSGRARLSAAVISNSSTCKIGGYSILSWARDHRMKGKLFWGIQPLKLPWIAWSSGLLRNER